MNEWVEEYLSGLEKIEYWCCHNDPKAYDLVAETCKDILLRYCEDLLAADGEVDIVAIHKMGKDGAVKYSLDGEIKYGKEEKRRSILREIE